jgi:hypothetical protein
MQATELFSHPSETVAEAQEIASVLLRHLRYAGGQRVNKRSPCLPSPFQPLRLTAVVQLLRYPLEMQARAPFSQPVHKHSRSTEIAKTTALVQPGHLYIAYRNPS